jgi:hypothetical protein
MARDVMLFCQQRDPARMPDAYPLPNSASLTPARQRADAKPTPQKLAKAGD